MNMWRYKRFHVSYLLAWGAFGILGGIIAAAYVQLSFSWVWMLSLGVLVVWAVRSARWFACVAIVFVGVSMGLLRGSVVQAELRATEKFIGQEVIVSGNISEDPVTQETASVWTVRLADMRVGDERAAGQAYMTVVSDEPLRRGDNVEVRAKLRDGFGNFTVTAYRAELLRHVTSNDPFLDLRDTFAQSVRKGVPEPEASLGLGFLVGQKSALPDDMSEAMRTVGLTHIVVASGYNLTVLVRFARRLLARKSRYLAIVGASTLVAGFVAVSGMSPSMNRAAIVTVLSLLAWYYGRIFHPVQLILYVAAGSALLNPMYVWGDLGWLLSFLAFFGVLVVAPLATRLFYKPNATPSVFVQLLVETIAALIMTLPVTIVVFGYIPVLSLVANILVVPVIPFAMFAVFIAGIVGFIHPLLSVAALPASILAAYVVSISQTLASISWGKMEITIAPFEVALWYGAMSVLLYMIWKKKQVDLRGSSVVD